VISVFFPIPKPENTNLMHGIRYQSKYPLKSKTMRKFTLLILSLMLAVPLLAQQNMQHTPNWNSMVLQQLYDGDGTIPGVQGINPVVNSDSRFEDYITMTSTYDLQTNSSVSNRVYYYPGDGTIGVTGTMAHESSFTDRGTGYNYFDGTAWGPAPSARIETVRTGWSSYAPYGPAGEIIVAHQSGTLPLIISKRDTKNTGPWTQSELYPPSGASGMLWPRMVTNGTDHMQVHIICMTAPTGNGGVVWNDLDGALVYNRSLDGGDTWDGWQLLDGMTSADFMAFSGDSYAWAEPQGDILCFTSGDNWYDQFIMKSTDNGTNWTKTTVWPCPYTFWVGGDTTETFYCADGSNTLAIDGNGKVHLAFGLQRARGDENGDKFYFPFTYGIVYWNEDMDPFPELMEWETLVEDGNIIGTLSDTNVLYVDETELAWYYNSLTSHPNLVIDEYDDIYCIWDEVTMLRDVNNYLLRHLYGTASFDGGETWPESVYVTSDFIYTWSECVFPFVAKNSTGSLYLSFQEDSESGLEFYGSQGAQGQISITQNNITAMEVPKAPFVNTPEREPVQWQMALYPNPAHDQLQIDLYLQNSGSGMILLQDITGKELMHHQLQYQSGNNHITLDISNITPGIYCCTVVANGKKQSQKIVIQ
jgi:hypothetical protein